MKIEFNGKFAFYLLRIKISSITICFSNCAPICIKGPTEAVMICSDKMSSSRPYFIFGLICYFVLWHPASRAVVMALSICTLLSPLLTYTYIVHVACKTHKLIKSYLFYVHVSKESSCTTDKTNQTQDNDKKCIITLWKFYFWDKLTRRWFREEAWGTLRTERRMDMFGSLN